MIVSACVAAGMPMVEPAAAGDSGVTARANGYDNRPSPATTPRAPRRPLLRHSPEQDPPPDAMPWPIGSRAFVAPAPAKGKSPSFTALATGDHGPDEVLTMLHAGDEHADKVKPDQHDREVGRQLVSLRYPLDAPVSVRRHHDAGDAD